MESVNILGSKIKKLQVKGEISPHEAVSIESRLTVKQSNLFLYLSANGPTGTLDLVTKFEVVNVADFARNVNRKLRLNDFNFLIESVGVKGKKGLWQITCEDAA